jgi:hypothetical protein
MATHSESVSRGIARQAALADRVATVRTKASTGNYDRWLLIVGGTLMPLGILLVILGWIGAAHTVLVFDQIPYLISGGLLGVALTFAGGFTYFTYWQTLRVREARAHQRELLDALARLERNGVGVSTSNGDGAATANRPGRLVATASGAMVHRADCPIVADRSDLREVDASSDGLRACRICSPDIVGN